MQTEQGDYCALESINHAKITALKFELAAF